MRIAVVAAIVCLSVVGLCAGQDANALIKKSTNIPAQELVPALKTLARERGFQVVFQSEVVGTKRTQGAVGEFTTTEALTKLLDGTDLAYSYLDEKTVTIVPMTAVPESTVTQSRDIPNKSFWDRLQLARVDPGTNSGAASVAQQIPTFQENSASAPVNLEEVIVTAQKREERLQDVPVPVTLINAQSLLDSNQLKLQGYYERVPGLVVAEGAQGFSQNISLRGIGNWGGGPAVSVLVDDVPFGSSTVLGGGGNTPDIDPSDLARIEVLRGPQGTLYGANSMGGLIKYVTLDPSTDGVTGRLEAETSTVHNSSDLGHNFRGAINLPLNDTLAIRGSAFTREDPGYINNVLTGKDGVNSENVYGGHLATLWRPSEDFSIKLSALVDHYRNDGWSDASPKLGGLRTNEIFGTGGDYQQQGYSATLKARLGSVNVTAISGYNVRRDSATIDYSSYARYFKNGVDGALTTTDTKTNKFTQEVRLSSTIANRVDWLLGGFYTHEKSNITQDLHSSDPVTGEDFGSGYYASNPTIYAELAGFADLTLHVTDRFDVQVGGRYSEIRQTIVPSYTTEPVFGLPGPIIGPTAHASSDPVTYLLTPRFKISPDLMLYARVASGYRAGGYNLAGSCSTFGYPCEYQPDKTKNYELGAKGDFLEHTFSFDASIYYIDWSNFQISEIKTQSYITNAGSAKSQGLELSVESRPLTGLTITAAFAYSDAVLTADLPVSAPAVGASGADLPYTSRYSGNLSLHQEFPIKGTLTGFAGASVSYVGDRKGIFVPIVAGLPEAPRDDFPAYTKVDLLAGLRFDAWNVKIYVDNVGDSRGVINGGISNFPSGQINYIRPRTAGLSVERKF